MGVLTDQGVEWVHHYAPLHYLPFIAASGKLMSKPSLAKAGFGIRHLRSKSSKHDVARGFGRYAFLTLDPQPRILRAKLTAGFPHIAIAVPASTVDESTYSLCRFNVAMTRYLRRDGSPGFLESATNGRYYESHQIPVARSAADKAAMLKKHFGNTMIEVLIHGDLILPNETVVHCYSAPDTAIARRVLREIGRPWKVEMARPPGLYPRSERHARTVDDFIAQALADPNWRGNGLEFDDL